MTYTINAAERDLNSEIEIDDEFKSRLKDMVHQILESQHDESIKHSIKQHGDRFQFACPYCGDSHKKLSKKRSNLYFDSLFIHCFNDGCPSPHVDTGSFLVDFGFSKSEITEKLGSYGAIKKFADDNKEHGISSFRRIQTDNSVKGDAFSALERHGIDKIDLFRKLNLKEVDRNEKMKKYLISRNQTGFEHFAFNSKGLWLFNLNSNKDKIVGMQLKTFNQSAPYITYNIQRIYKDFFKSDLKVDEPIMIERINNISTLFNIMYTRLTGLVTIFEGPMDSFLMDNSIALCTVGRNTESIEQLPNKRFMLDNDQAGKRRSIQKLDRGNYVFLWDKFVQDFNLENSNIKDYNDLINYQHKYKTDFSNVIDSYFSNNIYDKYYV